MPADLRELRDESRDIREPDPATAVPPSGSGSPESAAMRYYWTIIAILAVWRLTHLLNAEDGPWEMLARLRKVAGRGFWATLLDCFYCLSLWIALPAAIWIGESWKERLILWPALSGGACLLERLSAAAPPPPAAFSEDTQENHGMLRTEKD